MCYSFVHFAYYYILFPSIESFLLEPTYHGNFVAGSAMFALTASLAPSVRLLNLENVDFENLVHGSEKEE